MRFRFGQLRKMLGLGRSQTPVLAASPGGPVRAGRGPTLHCVCPRCGYVIEKEPGVPCWKYTCPRCGAQMVNPNNPFCRARQQTTQQS